MRANQQNIFSHVLKSSGDCKHQCIMCSYENLELALNHEIYFLIGIFFKDLAFQVVVISDPNI